METTLGGERLGSGNKQKLSFRNYERSSHDLGYVWRSSMAAGTLVPFLCKVGLPGDKWNIDLNTEVLTLPTLGPLFGSYKVQLDVFEIPIRLYNAKLHMNRLGIGMNMKEIYLPQMLVRTKNMFVGGGTPTFEDNEQINSASILKYLGVSGLGTYKSDNVDDPITRYFNAVPLLAYWDIYKNYYANKQEELGYHIHTSEVAFDANMTPMQAILYKKTGANKGSCLSPNTILMEAGDVCRVIYSSASIEPDATTLQIRVDGVAYTINQAFNNIRWDASTNNLWCEDTSSLGVGNEFSVDKIPTQAVAEPQGYFGLSSFPLNVIDEMRDSILQWNQAGAFVINHNSPAPYGSPFQYISEKQKYACVFSQEGLGLKTYQSDLFNNWINTEWIDGAGGISELTAVDTSGGDFTIDALNIASKVYDMLNRIAVSGGSYDDWLEAVYTHERVKGVENPVYCGSLIKELAFEEVVSLAEANTDSTTPRQPLGTLAGRGKLTSKHKGGKIEITVNEPSYIMGLVSITPRIDYSQGNEWDMNLKTLDDFHKPALDGIGFQDLITEQLLWSDTEILHGSNDPTKYKLGKQPAWINYMTSVNKTFGAFAEQNNSMWMTLNRRYERFPGVNEDGFLGKLYDKTTYIDPSKFNHIFAETALSSQNFWVQIAANITARRKMSAKIIPNL